MTSDDENVGAGSVVSRLREVFGGKADEKGAVEDEGGSGLAGSEWERWFGDPWRAAESIAAVSDYFGSMLDEIQGRGVSVARGFAGEVTDDGGRPWALSDVGTLVDFLEAAAPEESGENE